MSVYELDWLGAEVAARVRAAEASAIDETTSACVSQASSGRSGRTGMLSSEAAVTSGAETTGRWGLFPEPKGGSAWHEAFIEYGTWYHPGDNAKRRAADAEYPLLAGRIGSNIG